MSSAEYRIPAAPARADLTVSGSRFIARVTHAPTPDAARQWIDGVRTQHADATHNAWAFVAGPPGSSAQIGMSDDGEVKGTAGRPMLQILTHSGVGEIAAVVTRYYGGTKLGTGGLVRAYSGALKEVLAALGTRTRVVRQRLEIRTEYAHVDGVRRALANVDAEIVDERFTAAVVLIAEVPQAAMAELDEAVRAATGGTATVVAL